MAHFLYTLIIYPLYTLIECIYMFFFKVFDNPGIAIITVSVGITLLCLPLYAVAESWQEVERNKQNAMKKQLDRIKKAFKGDERYMMTTAYYKECKYRPIMSLRSSFGLMIQIPFFLAAYRFLSHLEGLKGISFLFIRDLGSPDALFSIGNFQVNVLPIAMTLINCISGIIYSKGHGIREKVQIFGMAAIFLVVLYNSPAGLVLYWTCNNLFSMVKNIFYKLKNPLKSFYIFTCAVSALLAFWSLFIFRTGIQFKLLIALVFVVIFCIPLILKGIQALLAGPLDSLVQNKKARHSIYILSCLLLCLLSGYTIPSTLISSSPTEFANIGEHSSPFYYIYNTLLQSAGLNIFWFLCIYFLFNAKIQTVLALFICAVSYGALLDSYVFMIAYGDISAFISFLNLSDFKTISFESLLNFLALLLLLAAVIFVMLKKKYKIFTGLSTIILLTLFAISVANSYTINKEYKEYVAATTGEADEVKPIFHLSKNHPNVLLFMLDRAQSPLVPEIMKEDPELAEVFSGFVLYENVVAYNGHTLQGAPALFGGYGYTPLEINKQTDLTFIEKINRSQLVLPRIFSENLGYRANVVDPTWINGSHFIDLSFLEPYPAIEGHQTKGAYTTLWYKNKNEYGLVDSTPATLSRNLFFFSLFREAPIFARELLYKNNFWNSSTSFQDVKEVLDNYAPLDYMIDLTEISDTETGTYTSFVNELTHENMYMQAPDYVPVSKPTQLSPNEKYKGDSSYYTEMATFKLLSKWIKYLKANGAYDNTRIIFVSDHGNGGYEDFFEKDDELDAKVHGRRYTGRGHFHPLLMYKDFNATGPFRSDTTTFMSNADCPSMLLSGLIDNPKDPFTGKEIPLDTSDLKKDGVVISASDLHQPVYHKTKFVFDIKDEEWWRVKDPVSASSSWSIEDVSAELAGKGNN